MATFLVILASYLLVVVIVLFLAGYYKDKLIDMDFCSHSDYREGVIQKAALIWIIMLVVVIITRLGKLQNRIIQLGNYLANNKKEKQKCSKSC